MKKVDWPKRMAAKAKRQRVAALAQRLKTSQRELFKKTVYFAEVIEGLIAQIPWLIEELDKLAKGFAGLAKSSPLLGFDQEARAYDRAARILYAEVRRRKLALENETWERRGDMLVKVPASEQQKKDEILTAIAQAQKEFLAWGQKLAGLAATGNKGVAEIRKAIPDLVERATENDADKVAATLELIRRIRLTDEEQKYLDMRRENGGRNDRACKVLDISEATGSRLLKSIRQKFEAAGITEEAFIAGAARRYRQTPDGDISECENGEM